MDDLALPGMLHAAFVRSPHAHAAVRAIDAAAARAVPGVVAVVTAADLGPIARPLSPRLEGDGFTPTVWPALAGDRVRFCGEAVALVVARSAVAAVDGREAVTVDYEPLPALASVDAGLRAGEVIFRRVFHRGDVDAVFAGAAVVLGETFAHGRVAPSPMEPRGLVADWDGEALTVHASTQSPGVLRVALAASLALPESAVRVVVPDVGGGFGLKAQVFPEDVAIAAASRLLGRPVKWVEERRECLAAASHAREQRVEVEVAADRAGRVLGLRARTLSDAGAYHVYPTTQALEPLGSAAILPGPYLTQAYAYEALAVRTNKPPLGAYRGVGMTMGAFVMERALDLVAARLGLDPAEIRRRNLIPREAYPFTSASGMIYDSGDFPKALEQALGIAGYEALRVEQKAARAAGRLIGIGIACYTEYTGMGAEVFRRRGMPDVPGIEAATVTMQPDATVRCRVSFPSQGQGHATAVAQVVADRLGVPLERVRLERVDTAASPIGTGTFGSRGAVSIGGSVGAAADRVRERIVTLAAHLLEASPADVIIGDGSAGVRGVPARRMPLADVARLAYAPPLGGLPPGVEPGLEATVHFDPPGPTFSGAVHVAVVEVDRETGRVRVLRYALVEDCGPLINPLLVEGQIHGAVAQGLGEALLEGLVHDTDGTLLTATLMDYALPRADDVPGFEIGHLETPAPRMPGGLKGMGEGGTIGAPAAIANAVADAVAPLGIAVTSLPIRAETLARPRKERT
ncbi:MAG: xanthine dehydrogenase family protein [Candidatus Rokubacteria bacterium]|nr:xanthine dehydrogenase family protein [Candidatus Rokubacteria bacterium]MBI3826848.1 xanthine dehydrogenase family protein [Candidatus Rokubacteria bacterium]